MNPVNGLRTTASAFGPKETMDRLESAVRARGLEVFLRLDHAAAAARVNLTLRPTELLVFGAAPAGTPLMQAYQTIGIGLPLKALVWEDAAGATWLSYDEPEWIASRHGDGATTAATTSRLAAALEALTKAATA